MNAPTLHLWQPTLADHALLVQAQALYERALDSSERIPWVWIERSVIDRDGAPEGWRKHLILASLGGELAGLCYGAFLPGFGGYLCYVAVEEKFRGLGTAKRLYEAFYDAMRSDASASGEPLLFVLWESHRPEQDAGLWQARLKLFDRVGGQWLRGLNLLTPNFDGGEPVPLQVFLKPMDEPATNFDADRLTRIIDELLERVYTQTPGDPLYDGTLNEDTRPGLAPPMEAR